MDPEKAVLVRSLANQRAHVLGALEGLAEAALRRPVLPTGWTCLSMVQHLTVDVERFWFSDVFGGLDGQGRVDEDADDPAAGWKVPEEVAAQSVFDAYRRAGEEATAVIAQSPLETAPRNWPSYFGEFRLENLREIVLHVITETACHAGHLDAARELLDGGTWLILTE